MEVTDACRPDNHSAETNCSQDHMTVIRSTELTQGSTAVERSRSVCARPGPGPRSERRRRRDARRGSAASQLPPQGLHDRRRLLCAVQGLRADDAPICGVRARRVFHATTIITDLQEAAGDRRGLRDGRRQRHGRGDGPPPV